MKIGIAVACALASAALGANTAGGIKWTPPPSWKAEAQRPMRAATYTMPGDGECVVYYFGPGQGGSVEDNIKRWSSQFPDGKPQVEKKTIRGLQVTTIDVSGSYTGAGGPMGTRQTRAGYRLLGAIVEAPQGPVFFKFTGPAKTVAARQKEFESLLQSVSR
jgi:hypothetical protein